MEEQVESKSLFREALDVIEKNKVNKDSGVYNSIPFGIPALDRHTPGIMRGVVYSVVAGTGIGKTQFSKFLFVLQAYKFVKEHPELNIKLKIIYFALEESREEFMINLICNRLKEKYNINVSALQLRSMGEFTLSDEILEKVKECENYFEDMGRYLDIVDHKYNPTGMLFHCRSYSDANGTHYYRLLNNSNPSDEDLISKDTYQSLPKKSQEKYCYFKYVPTDPDEFVIVLTDHVSLVECEAGAETKHLAMSRWSTDYCRKVLSKKYNYCVVQIQQLEMAGEKQQFTFGGDSVINKLLPSLDKLADNKIIGRDYYIVLGLFAPERYQIPNYLGYDVTKLRDRFRVCMILKNRLGTPNLSLPLYFNGATNTFAQLPDPKSDQMKLIYDRLQ